MDVELVLQEFPQLQDTTYLDHAGTTLYSRSLIESYQADLLSHLYGNPHSQNPSSEQSTNTIDYVRNLVLHHFGTDSSHYDVIFTSGCTAGMKLVGEIFPWVEAPPTSNGMLYINGDNPNELPHLSSTTENESIEDELTNSAINNRSVFCYLEDNHTSLIGIREIASARGARLVCIGEETAIDYDSFPSILTHLQTNSATSSSAAATQCHHLFAYPAQSNFNGHKYPLSWCKDVPCGGVPLSQLKNTCGQWLVLLDAAGFVSTNSLDLRLHLPHFVTLSFYKIFGFPTGLGALLIRQDIGERLKKTYFGGGTVTASITRNGFKQFRPKLHERYEDGTVSFLSILALKYGFESLQRFKLTMSIISNHTFALASYVYDKMASMSYSNGSPLCALYHAKDDFTDISRQGGIVTFNLLRQDGSFIGYSEVDRMAHSYNIHLRTGCFCNSGACQKYLGLTNERIIENMNAGHSCGDDIDIINGRPTGCVRISFGYMSSWEDVRIFIRFLTKWIVQPKISSSTDSIATPDSIATIIPVTDQTRVDGSTMIMENGLESHGDYGKHLSSSSVVENNSTLPETVPFSSDSRVITSGCGITVKQVEVGAPIPLQYILKKIIVYPVKSCGGYEVDQWIICKTGLKWDREWLIVDDRRVCQSQKKLPLLARIKPRVNPSTGVLTLSCVGEDTSITVDEVTMDTVLCTSKVCADSVEGIDCGDKVAEWLTMVLKKRSRLMRIAQNNERKGKEDVSLSFTNQAQYLMITMDSVAYFHSLITGENKELLNVIRTPIDLALRFRPNLLVGVAMPTDRASPFTEDSWKTVDISGIEMQVVDKCTRCQMICVDQSDGTRSPEVYRTLTNNRGSKATFGIYLSHSITD